MTNKAILIGDDDEKVVSKGRETWKRVGANEKRSWEDWKLIGDALLIGRRLHKSNNHFSKWLSENGFGDMKTEARSNALWFSENYSVLLEKQDRITDNHPTNIRTSYNRILAENKTREAALKSHGQLQRRWTEFSYNWKCIGEFLQIGRKENPQDADFDKWCDENGLHYMPKKTREDAIWFAAHWTSVQVFGPSILADHPTTFRLIYESR